MGNGARGLPPLVGSLGGVKTKVFSRPLNSILLHVPWAPSGPLTSQDTGPPLSWGGQGRGSDPLGNIRILRTF